MSGALLPTPFSPLERAAHAYAKRGMRVIPLHNLEPDGKCSCDGWRARQGLEPCKTPGKHPRLNRWAEKGTVDPHCIADWWKAWPNANVGCVSGNRSNLIVLDTDPRNGGDWSRGRLIREIGELPRCATCATGGGGMHEHFTWPEGLETAQSVVMLDDGLEILLEGHNVVMPPSFAHMGGRPYFWDEGEGIPPAPAALVELIKSKLQPGTPAEHERSGATWPAADIGRILRGCEWMRYCCEHAASLSEPEWYSQLSIVGRCENGEKLAHDLSSPYPGYSAAETAAKLRHAVEDAGPATCAKICNSLGGARFCEHCTARVKSPVVLGTAAGAVDRGSVQEQPAAHGRRGSDSNDPPEAPDSGTPADNGPGLPQIIVNNRQLRNVSDEALQALQSANQPEPFLFARGGLMVGVVLNEKRQHVISTVNESGLRGHLTRCADFFKRGVSGGLSQCHPPLEVVRDILALAPACWDFLPLDAVAESPVLRPDGSVVEVPGYDRETKLYYAPDQALNVPPIPEDPSRDHIDVALDLVDRLIGEFPFAEDFSRTNALAALLTPIVRPAINAPVPMALFDAPQAGTGKSLLADVISIVATGRPGEMFSAPRDEDEWRKQLTTALMSGCALVIIDNITRRLDNGDLCKCLTETQHADRAFRTHEKITLPVKCSFVATGNNIALGGDMPRRCYWIRLDAKSSRPFMRTGFQIADLKGWTIAHRGELLAALLTLARAWFHAGRPKPEITPLGSYEVWSTTVGGILEHAGVRGFLGNADQLYEFADSDGAQWEAFLRTLHGVFHGEEFTAAGIFGKLREKSWNGQTTEPSSGASELREALPDYLAEAADKEGFFQKRCGRCFSERVGRRYGSAEVFLQRGGVTHKTQRWIVEMPVTGGLA